MALSLEDIKKISQLAKININPEQEEIVLKKLKNILNLVEKMQSIDTEGVEPMSHALDISQPLREDKAMPSLNKEKYLKLSTKSNEDYFIVPQVIE
jgi:aspartyl-tRNA(Asn)/glutamyl-tRNA(Gln) amidotransferase subunit C